MDRVTQLLLGMSFKRLFVDSESFVTMLATWASIQPILPVPNPEWTGIGLKPKLCWLSDYVVCAIKLYFKWMVMVSVLCFRINLFLSSSMSESSWIHLVSICDSAGRKFQSFLSHRRAGVRLLVHCFKCSMPSETFTH